MVHHVGIKEGPLISESKALPSGPCAPVHDVNPILKILYGDGTQSRDWQSPGSTSQPLYERYEPPHEKTNNLHRRKQRRRSASR